MTSLPTATVVGSESKTADLDSPNQSLWFGLPTTVVVAVSEVDYEHTSDPRAGSKTCREVHPHPTA